LKISVSDFETHEGLADKLGQAADEFSASITTAVGVEWPRAEDLLRQELGHESPLDD
jgi:hypothetical protein